MNQYESVCMCMGHPFRFVCFLENKKEASVDFNCTWKLPFSGVVLLWQSTVTRVCTLIWRILATLQASGTCTAPMHLHPTTLFRFGFFLLFVHYENEKVKHLHNSKGTVNGLSEETV